MKVPFGASPRNVVSHAVLKKRAIINIAHMQLHKEGEVEIDRNCKVYEDAERGTFVQAWVKVDLPKVDDSTREGKKQLMREFAQFMEALETK